jgi:hypothetical protein
MSDMQMCDWAGGQLTTAVARCAADDGAIQALRSRSHPQEASQVGKRVDLQRLSLDILETDASKSSERARPDTGLASQLGPYRSQ